MKKVNRNTITTLVLNLKNAPKHDPFLKSMLSLVIRNVTEYKQRYKITPLLKQVLKDFELYTDDEISMNQMRYLNKKLKERGYKSAKAAIQLEHWKEVKVMRAELLNFEFSPNKLPTKADIDKVESYFRKETNCFFKLAEKEWNLQRQFVQ